MREAIDGAPPEKPYSSSFQMPPISHHCPASNGIASPSPRPSSASALPRVQLRSLLSAPPAHHPQSQRLSLASLSSGAAHHPQHRYLRTHAWDHQVNLQLQGPAARVYAAGPAATRRSLPGKQSVNAVASRSTKLEPYRLVRRHGLEVERAEQLAADRAIGQGWVEDAGLAHWDALRAPGDFQAVAHVAKGQVGSMAAVRLLLHYTDCCKAQCSSRTGTSTCTGHVHDDGAIRR